MKTKNHSNRAGFSILEMALSLAIMAVLSLVGVGSAVNRMPAYRLDRTIQQMSGEVLAARSLAAAINEDVTILFDDSGHYRIWADHNGDERMGAEEVESRQLDYPKEIDVFGYPAKLTFRPTGRFSDDMSFAYVSASSTHGYKHFYIFPSGQISWPQTTTN